MTSSSNLLGGQAEEEKSFYAEVFNATNQKLKLLKNSQFIQSSLDELLVLYEQLNARLLVDKQKNSEGVQKEVQNLKEFKAKLPKSGALDENTKATLKRLIFAVNGKFDLILRTHMDRFKELDSKKNELKNLSDKFPIMNSKKQLEQLSIMDLIDKITSKASVENASLDVDPVIKAAREARAALETAGQPKNPHLEEFLTAYDSCQFYIKSKEALKKKRDELQDVLSESGTPALTLEEIEANAKVDKQAARVLQLIAPMRAKLKLPEDIENQIRDIRKAVEAARYEKLKEPWLLAEAKIKKEVESWLLTAMHPNYLLAKIANTAGTLIPNEISIHADDKGGFGKKGRALKFEKIKQELNKWTRRIENLNIDQPSSPAATAPIVLEKDMYVQAFKQVNDSRGNPATKLPGQLNFQEIEQLTRFGNQATKAAAQKLLELIDVNSGKLRLPKQIEFKIKRLRKAAQVSTQIGLKNRWRDFESAVRGNLENALRTVMQDSFLQPMTTKEVNGQLKLIPNTNYILAKGKGGFGHKHRNKLIQEINRDLDKWTGELAEELETISETAVRENAPLVKALTDKLNDYAIEIETCDLLTTAVAPDKDRLDSLATQARTAYVLCNDKLFYINKEEKTCIEIALSEPQLTAFKQALTPADQARALSKKELEKITEITNHVATEKPDASKKRVAEILGKDGVKTLYGKEATPSNPTTKREEFIKLLVALMADRSNNLQFEGEAKDDPRKKDPNSHVITMLDLLGSAKNVKLYEDAIEEERKSTAFRDAVLLKSTNRYEGPKWDQRLILWVAGPSASGKSFAAEEVIKKVGSTVMQSSSQDNKGNLVVSVDGGIEREVSQMRQLVLQMALQKGFPGIRDLHDHTELGLKKIIQEAALTQKDLNLVIPDTFSKYRSPTAAATVKSSRFLKAMPKVKKLATAYIIPELDKLPNTKQVFSEIIAPVGKEAEFQATVARMGTSRAWSDEFDPEHTTLRQLRMNNRNIGCESKKYGAGDFESGRLGSENARKEYLQHSKDKIYLPLTNDLLFVYQKDKDPSNWVICDKDYQGESEKISTRYFELWKAYKDKGFKSDLPHFPEGLNNLKDWLKAYEKAMGRCPPLLKLIKDGVELPDKPKGSAAPTKPGAKKGPGLFYSAQASGKTTPFAKLSATGLAQLEKAKGGDINHLGRSFNSSILGPEIKDWAKNLFQDCEALKIEEAFSKAKIDITGGEYSEEWDRHVDEALVDSDGNLAEWVKKLLPLETQQPFMLFFKKYCETLGELAFTPQALPQPWVIEALGKQNYNEVMNKSKHKHTEVLPQISAGVEFILNEALLEASIENPVTAPQLATFLTVAAKFTRHRQRFSSEFSSSVLELKKLKKQRHPDEGIELSINAIFDKCEKNMKELLIHPHTDISDMRAFAEDALENVRAEIKKINEGQVILAEKSTSSSPSKTKKSSPSFKFSAARPAAELTSHQTLKKLKALPQTRQVTLSQKNKKIEATLVEHRNQSGNIPISDITHLSGSINTAQILAEAAYNFKDFSNGKALNLFPDLNTARKFFNSTITYLRKNEGAFSKDGLAAVISNKFPDLAADQLSMLASSLFKTYKNATEQLEPYLQDPELHDPYDENCYHFPSDGFIRLAKHHVDSYMALCDEENPEIVIGTNCWDPHYIEAVRLYCDMMELPPPEYDKEEGWEIDVTEPIPAEKKAAFKALYEKKFAELDKTLVVDYQPTVQKKDKNLSLGVGGV